jgi:hypothetical protein
MTMKVGDKEVSFRWSNYTRPTPANLERLAGAIRDTLAGITAVSVYNNLPEWACASIALSIIVVGQAVKFFASIAQEEKNNQPPTA